MGLINLGETIVVLRTEVDRFRKERDQYKTERDALIEKNKKLEKLNEALKFSESMLWRSSRDLN